MSLHPRPASRRCEHIDADGVRCITVLCSFNAGPCCFTHTARRHRRQATVAELMRQPEGERVAA